MVLGCYRCAAGRWVCALHWMENLRFGEHCRLSEINRILFVVRVYKQTSPCVISVRHWHVEHRCAELSESIRQSQRDGAS